MALNGILAGLVGITANADVVSVMDSIVIGAIAGGIVVISIILLDKVKIDDPVGAISVHGVCGIWGTIAVAIFGDGDFSMATQIQGALLVSVFAFVFAYVVFFVLKMTIGVRVSEEEEERGLDITEHGQEAYSS
jgi:Amt family ammonium transporter